MMGGLGSFGTGSFSTLSPLAPPFTVDRPSSKLNPSLTVPAPRAFGDFTDFPPNTSADNWLHLHPPASVSDTESIMGTGYGYSGSQPQRTHMPSVSPAHVLSYDSEAVASGLLGPETYYTPFQVPTEGSSAVDFSSKFSGFGYASKWAGSWDGTFDRERNDVDSRLQWKEPRGKAIFTNFRTPVSQGGLSPVAMAESEEAPGIRQESSFNPFAKTVQLGPRGAASEWVDFRFSEDSSSCFHSWNDITAPCSDSAIHESHLPMVSSVSVLNAREHFKPQTSSYTRSYYQVDSGLMKPTDSSPESVLPATSSQLAECNHTYLEKVGGVLSKLVTYTDEEVYTYKSKEDSLTLVSGNNGHSVLTSDVKKNYSSDAYCSKEINLTLDFSDDALNGKPELENSALIHPNTFTFTSGVVCHNDSARSSSEMSDQVNHTVDSPCWKGLPASQHSPFAVAFTVPHVPPIKEPISCAFPTRKLIDESEIVSSPKLYGSLCFQGNVNNEGSSSTSLPNPSSVDSFPTSECQSTAADKIRSEYFSSQFGNMVQSSGGSQDTANDALLFGSTKCALETSEEVSVSTKKDVLASDLFHGIKGHLSEGSFPDEDVSNKTSSGVTVRDEISKLIGAFDAAKSCPALKVDALVLVKMLHNLSELLLSGHFCDIKSLQDPDYETLDQVINNLSTFALVRKVPEPFLELGGSNFVRKSTNHSHQGNFSGKNSVARSGYDDNRQNSFHDSPTSYKEVNDFQGISFESKVDSQNDVGITQALKKALMESVCGPEETSPQTMLYKNLWIEAEAAICCMKYEAQLERMKMVMEGSCYSPAKGTSMSMEKLSAANDLRCENKIVAPSDENKPSENIILQDYCRQNYVLRESTHEVSMNNEVTDVDSSVLARFRILKSRTENLSSPNDMGMQQGSKPVDNQVNVGVHETVLARSCLERKPNTSMMDGTVPGLPCFETNQDVGNTNDPLRDLQKVVIHRASGSGMSSRSFLSGVENENVALGKNCSAPQDTAAGNMTSQLLISGSNSSGSDWEHIVKEDISGQK